MGGRHGWDGRLDAMAGWDAGEIKNNTNALEFANTNYWAN